MVFSKWKKWWSRDSELMSLVPGYIKPTPGTFRSGVPNLRVPVFFLLFLGVLGRRAWLPGSPVLGVPGAGYI